MKAFWDWLITDAGAGWIIGILGVVGGLYAWVKRDRPAKIVVQEIDAIRLLNIHPTQKDKLHVSYTDPQGTVDIRDLVQLTVVIYNNGTMDITDPVEILLKLGSRDDENGFQGFWRIVFDDPVNYTYDPVIDSANNKSTGAIIKLPYLNSYLKHGKFVRAYIISDKIIALNSSKGEGKGWSSRLITYEILDELNRRMNFILIPLLVILVISLLYISLLFTRDTPILITFFNPTDENIEKYTQMMRDALKAWQRSDYLGYMRELGGLASSTFIISLIFVLLPVLWMLREMVLYKLINVQSPARFLRRSKP